MKYSLLLLFQFFTVFLFSQNYRDNVIKEIRKESFRLSKNDKQQYLNTKEQILKLESDYGYEVDLKLRLIESSYLHNDLGFFKEQLEILVSNHGFNVAYLSGRESYFDALMNGELSSWFKAMYLKSHFVWLEKNFEKQIDQRKLHDNEVINKAIQTVVSKVYQTESISEEDKKMVNAKCNEYLFSTVSFLHDLCRKYDQYPTGKNFGIVQTSGFSSNLYLNLSIKENMERTWLLFEPYIRKSYLKHETDYGEYVVYDTFSYIHFGHQKYGLITVEDLPLQLRSTAAEIKSIPIENAFFVDKTKRELGWK